ncbi:hypothetical protein Q1695_004294 [Nippostrongylus brasiliensis]|nr:hypothetical protein Q1695_004294 [Nippostrongylus brasiliensis]
MAGRSRVDGLLELKRSVQVFRVWHFWHLVFIFIWYINQYIYSAIINMMLIMYVCFTKKRQKKASPAF